MLIVFIDLEKSCMQNYKLVQRVALEKGSCKIPRGQSSSSEEHEWACKYHNLLWEIHCQDRVCHLEHLSWWWRQRRDERGRQKPQGSMNAGAFSANLNSPSSGENAFLHFSSFSHPHQQNSLRSFQLTDTENIFSGGSGVFSMLNGVRPAGVRKLSCVIISTFTSVKWFSSCSHTHKAPTVRIPGCVLQDPCRINGLFPSFIFQPDWMNAEGGRAGPQK